mmetsp:Transcript_12820/g.31221  ORF Transcript_12820/g.31221 Transcript_12820/m.31221 type:complete len:183 (-) Transcript_12820:46-594(-)
MLQSQKSARIGMTHRQPCSCGCACHKSASSVFCIAIVYINYILRETDGSASVSLRLEHGGHKCRAVGRVSDSGVSRLDLEVGMSVAGGRAQKIGGWALTRSVQLALQEGVVASAELLKDQDDEVDVSDADSGLRKRDNSVVAFKFADDDENPGGQRVVEEKEPLLLTSGAGRFLGGYQADLE